MNRSYARKAGRGIAVALMCGTALLSGSAMAADLAETYNSGPGFTWSGIYFGINGGFGFAKSRHIDTLGTTSGSFDQSGGLIGGTIGYNWQVNNIVFGLEGDWDFASIDGSTTIGCAVGCKTDLQSFGSLRPRIGYAFDRFMPYITGGLAWGLIEAGQPGFYHSSWETGWTVGGGVEMQFTPNLSAKAEYLYADLGDGGYTVAIPVSAHENNLNIFRLGLNYRFGGNPFSGN